MKIRGDALELAFRIVLSCPCAVTHGEEQAVFAYLRGLGADEVADYAPVLAAFGSEDTPFHGLAAFTEWMAPDPSDATIEREHVLRCNALRLPLAARRGDAAREVAARLVDLDATCSRTW